MGLHWTWYQWLLVPIILMIVVVFITPYYIMMTPYWCLKQTIKTRKDK
jgi:hypothetical protein